MGVLACDRYCCENIMCERMVLDGEMYICNRCYEELREHWDRECSGVSMSVEDVRRFIVDFMHSPVGTHGRKMSGQELQNEFERLANDYRHNW